MAHFAKLDENNKVITVNVVNNDDILDADGNESETVGVAFLTQLTNHTNWKQTSYNANFRKHYAGIGYTYDESRDAFIPPKPFPSWVLNEETLDWIAPIPYPADYLDYYYEWIEATQSWKKHVGSYKDLQNGLGSL